MLQPPPLTNLHIKVAPFNFHSDNEEDIFSLDKYNRRESTSSDSDEEHTFGVSPPAPAKIHSTVFLDSQEYEWDIGESPSK